MSALAGDLDDALAAYREAASLVPERALPHASQGTMLHRLDRWPEAAEAFDRALRGSPDDEGTLRARAIAREERGMRSGAAEDLERLAFVLDVAGRGPEAAEAARRANELEPSPGRLALAGRLTKALLAEAAPAEAAPPDSLPSEPETFAAPSDAPADELVVEQTVAPPAALEEPELDVDPLTVGADEPMFTPVVRRVIAETDAEVARATQHANPATSWPRIDLPTPTHELVGPPPDTEQLMAEASALFDVGDSAGASERMLTAIAVHRAAGRLDAALDACFQLLAITPGDPHVHLALANLQLDQGWTPLAREKIELLVRLTSLTGDTQAAADTHGLAAERLRDEPVGSASRG